MIFFKKYKYEIVLFLLIILYVLYFSYLTIVRHKSLNSSYYDLGIMDQTVYNTSKGRFLELTDPTKTQNIKRMAIHNDILLALIAPFYFIYKGPETLLIIQSIVLALGAVPIYWLSFSILKNKKLSLLFSFSYLLYPPLQRANIFDFHAVALSTTFLLFMFYYAYIKKYLTSFIFFILSIFSKEQVALATMLVGLFFFFKRRAILQKSSGAKLKNENKWYGGLIFIMSLIWFVLSIWFIIPYFRKGPHFALSHYSDFGDTSFSILKGLLFKPYSYSNYIFHIDTLRYFFFLFGHTAFLSLFAPFYILLALPEFVINLLSNNWDMRNIIFHYTAVITPFIFISSIFGAKKIMKRFRFFTINKLFTIVALSAFLMSYFKGPLPYSKEAEKYPKPTAKEIQNITVWKKILKNENLIISATPKLSAHFTARKIFYLFDSRYVYSDYIIIRKSDIKNKVYPYYLDNKIDQYYFSLQNNQLFEKISDEGGIEVYKKVIK